MSTGGRDESLERLTERLRLALDAGGLGTWMWDLGTGIVDWDERLESLFGLAPGTFDGQFETYRSLLHPDDVDEVVGVVKRALDDHARYLVEHRVVWPDGSVRWLLAAGQATVDEAGEATGIIGCVTDVTTQVEAEHHRQQLMREAVESAQQERRSRSRLELLGRINDALNLSRDRAELMEAVVATSVPHLGDICSIHVLPDSGSGPPKVAVAAVDADLEELARRSFELEPYDSQAAEGVGTVIRTGTTEFTFDREAPGPSSSITVPLRKRNRILGAMQFAMGAPVRRYTPDDVTLAEAIASRIASSLENRRLSEHQVAIAATLQASLLPTEIPEIGGIDLAVRYWATGEGTEVGGDFYDVFQLADGAWAFVIGDVCGTGPTAAGVTGLARHTIAAAAWHGDEPSEVLRHLNRTMLQRKIDTFCTAAVMQLTEARGRFDVALACGGHPLPVVVRADGTVSTLGRPGNMLGVFDDVRVATSTDALHVGDVVVFYTDGVTDVPPPHDLDPEQFAAMVRTAALSTTTADELLGHLDAELAGLLAIEARVDDMALFALRIEAVP